MNERSYSVTPYSGNNRLQFKQLEHCLLCMRLEWSRVRALLDSWRKLEAGAGEFREPLKSFLSRGSMDEHNLGEDCAQASRLVPNKVQTILLVAPFNLKCVGIRIKVRSNHRMTARSWLNFHNFPDYIAGHYWMRCARHFGSKFSNRIRIYVHANRSGNYLPRDGHWESHCWRE